MQTYERERETREGARSKEAITFPNLNLTLCIQKQKNEKVKDVSLSKRKRKRFQMKKRKKTIAKRGSDRHARSNYKESKKGQIGGSSMTVHTVPHPNKETVTKK